MSQATATTETVENEVRVGRSLWADAARRIRRDPAAMVCLGIIVAYALVALTIGFFVPDWDQMHDYERINRPPSARDWLGTDEFGRSVLVKTLLGAQVSMTVGLMANVVAVPLGIVIGAAAGYYGGWLDDVIVWLYTTLSTIPGLVRVIAIRFAFQGVVLWADTAFEIDFGGLPGIILAMSVTGWIGTCRLVRAETLKIRELDYVLAARAAGRRGPAILLRHVVPNVSHFGIINFSLGFIGAVQAEVALTYLGIGVSGVPSWGQMINSAQMDLVVGRWWQIAAAGGAMFLLVLALNLFGDRLRDALDPKLRRA